MLEALYNIQVCPYSLYILYICNTCTNALRTNKKVHLYIYSIAFNFLLTQSSIHITLNYALVFQCHLKDLPCNGLFA